MDYEQWMDRAKEVIDGQLQIGTKFEVKSLFSGHEWENLSRGERTGFGMYFSNAVKEGSVVGVDRCENGKARHNQYIKRG